MGKGMKGTKKGAAPGGICTTKHGKKKGGGK